MPQCDITPETKRRKAARSPRHTLTSLTFYRYAGTPAFVAASFRWPSWSWFNLSAPRSGLRNGLHVSQQKYISRNSDRQNNRRRNKRSGIAPRNSDDITRRYRSCNGRNLIAEIHNAANRPHAFFRRNQRLHQPSSDNQLRHGRTQPRRAGVIRGVLQIQMMRVGKICWQPRQQQVENIIVRTIAKRQAANFRLP